MFVLLLVGNFLASITALPFLRDGIFVTENVIIMFTSLQLFYSIFMTKLTNFVMFRQNSRSSEGFDPCLVASQIFQF